jgi:hypothetical protein
VESRHSPKHKGDEYEQSRYDLILVARSQAQLEALAKRLKAETGRSVKTLPPTSTTRLTSNTSRMAPGASSAICNRSAPGLATLSPWRFQRRQDGHTMPVKNEQDNAITGQFLVITSSQSSLVRQQVTNGHH